MNAAQMRTRCPNATYRFVGKVGTRRLTFPRLSKNWQCGVASIETSEGSVVWGIVYEVPEADRPALDEKEGYRDGRATNSYKRCPIAVENTQGIINDCFTYIAVPDGGTWRPSRDYLNQIISGAEPRINEGLDPTYVEALRQIETQ